ncbi:MAG: hypothetical protein KAU52_06410 [Methanosarcinales archaeon]|nr:hypothetical protein [Methanosarcinales archaeon]
MNSKVLMLSVAVIAIGLFALPSTLSMFAGQHSWYDPKSDGIPCQKCHFLEDDELSASGGPHDTDYDALINTSMDYGNGTTTNGVGGALFWGTGNSITDRCYGCHQRGGSYGYTGYDDLNGTWETDRNEKHAAIAVWCIDCHPWVETELKHTKAAHKPFYEDLVNETDDMHLQKENRACLGCHTHVGVNITWDRNEYLSYNVSCTSGGYNVSLNNTPGSFGTNGSKHGSESGWQW